MGNQAGTFGPRKKPGIALNQGTDLNIKRNPSTAVYDLRDTAKAALYIEEALNFSVILSKSGVVLACSPAAKRPVGCSPSRLLGKLFLSFISKSHKAEFKEALSRITSEGLISFESFLVLESGAEFPVSIDLNLTLYNHAEACLCSVREPDLEKTAPIRSPDTGDGNELRSIDSFIKSDEYFRTFDNIPGIVLIRKSLSQGILYISPQIEEICGYSSLDFYRDPELKAKLIHPDDREVYTQLKSELKSSEPKSIEVEYRITHRHHRSFRWVFERQHPVSSKESENVYFDSILWDITEKKTLESELYLSQQMEILGRLASGIAHDFNNHLTSILGQITLALEKLGQRHPCYSGLAAAERAALTCAETTKDLFTLGQETPHKLEPLAVDALAKETVTVVRNILPSTINIKLITENNLKAVMGNPAQLQQVLMNLIVNAKDAMPDCGTLTISLSNKCIEGAKAAENALPEGEYIKIEVKDSGIGIPDPNLPYIFEPFFTTKGKSNGTGLGLSTVYSIIKSHKGNITVFSAEERGTCFRIMLPAIKEEPPVHKVERPALKHGCGETILVADDDEMVLSMTETALATYNYKVLRAVNGTEALNLYKTHRNTISLCIVDQTMPGLSGREVRDKILEINPEGRVILTSGYDLKSMDRDQLSLSNTAFLSKPFPVSALLDMVHDMIE